MAKFKDQLASNANYQPEMTSAPCFTISHYAGNIKYTSHGFLARNRDELSEDVKEVGGLCLPISSMLLLVLFLHVVVACCHCFWSGKASPHGATVQVCRASNNELIRRLFSDDDKVRSLWQLCGLNMFDLFAQFVCHFSLEV